MHTFTTAGIILRVTDTFEDSRLCVLLTPEGQRTVGASGARKLDNPLFAATNPLTHAEYGVIYRDGPIGLLRGATIKDSFAALHSKPDAAYAALRIAGTACRISLPAPEPSGESLTLYRLTLAAFRALCNDVDPRAAECLYTLRALFETGFALTTDRCALCGAGPAAVNVHSGGVLCAPCARREGVGGCRGGTLKALGHASSAPLNKLFSVRMDGGVADELEAVIRALSDAMS